MALLGTALTVGAPRVADLRHATTETVVRAFYAAISETIRTGDVAAVEAVAADDLVTTLLPVGDSYLPESSLDRGELRSWLIGAGWDLTEGAQVESLAVGLATHLPSGKPVVAVGRVTLAPGASLPPAETSRPLLLAVEHGALRLRAGNDSVWVRRGARDWNGTIAAGTLASGDGAQFHAGTIMALDNPASEPVVITIFAILPDDGSTGTHRSGAQTTSSSA